MCISISYSCAYKFTLFTFLYRSISPVNNIGISAITFGEGWHNYHHIFPWDYKVAELKYLIDFTTVFIDFFACLGLAYDLKTAKVDMIKKRILRNDGTINEIKHE